MGSAPSIPKIFSKIVKLKLDELKYTFCQNIPTILKVIIQISHIPFKILKTFLTKMFIFLKKRG